MHTKVKQADTDSTTQHFYISTGKYSRVGDQITKDQHTYLICTRQQATKQKAVKYLLLKTPAREYISSLYNTSISGKYHFEFRRLQYTLFTSTDEAIITLRSRAEFVDPQKAKNI